LPALLLLLPGRAAPPALVLLLPFRAARAGAPPACDRAPPLLLLA
jgi:hypothetical protein